MHLIKEIISLKSYVVNSNIYYRYKIGKVIVPKIMCNSLFIMSKKLVQIKNCSHFC